LTGLRVILVSVKMNRRRRSLLALAMLAALLPSVMYLGHWSIRVPLPGTGAFVAVGMRAEHEAQASEGGHEEHCHGTASCSESPPVPVSPPLALLNETLALLAAAGLLVAVAVAAGRLRALASVRPAPPPPRLVAW
jgi:hypothetical protein